MKTTFLKKLTFIVSITIVLCGTSVTFTGCEAIKRFLKILPDILDNTNSILDEAVNNITANAENYATILQGAINDVKNAHVKEQLEDALSLAIKNVSDELKCDIQFTGDYLIKRIRAIKAEYNNQPLPPQYPMICVVYPDAINMNLPANMRNDVTISGYFLKENRNSFKLYLYSSGGLVADRTSDLSLSTDYKLKINLGSNGITLSQNSSKLVLKLDDEIISEIVVLQRQPEPCATKTWTYGNLPNIVVYPVHKDFPGRSGGDKEFSGHGPCVRASVTVFTRNNNRELWARCWVQMWECPDDISKSRSDYTYGDATEEIKLATVEDGFKIKRINITTNDDLAYIDYGTGIETRPGGGPVSQYRILGDTDGDDVGESWLEVSFRSINVTLIEIGDCIQN